MTREEILTAAAKICLANNFVPWNLGSCEERQITDCYDSWMIDECRKKLIGILMADKPMVKVPFWAIGKPQTELTESEVNTLRNEGRLCFLSEVGAPKYEIFSGMDITKFYLDVTASAINLYTLVKQVRFNKYSRYGNRVFIGFGDTEPVFKQPEITNNALTVNGIML